MFNRFFKLYYKSFFLLMMCILISLGANLEKSIFLKIFNKKKDFFQTAKNLYKNVSFYGIFVLFFFKNFILLFSRLVR